MKIFLVLATALVASASAAPAKGSSSSTVCEKSKFPYMIPDASQCDRFVRCDNMVATDELCEDGYVFDEPQQKCDLPYHVDCSGRSALQPPKGVGNCSRLNGIFAVPNTCDQHFFCRAGQPMLIECAPGLIFDDKAGVCEFPDVAMRPGCLPEEHLGFKCPMHKEGEILTFGDHERHPKPSDCRFFFKCMANGMPRLGGCPVGQVYNPANWSCDLPKNVKGCENYYKSLGNDN